MKIVKTETLKINIVNGKVLCARNLKTGRFVKLAIAKRELKAHYEAKSNKQASFSTNTAALALVTMFVFFFFALMLKNDGFVFAQYMCIFTLAVMAIFATISIATCIYNVFCDMIVNKQFNQVSF